MSDPDDVLPLGNDVVVSSDSDVTKSDITINSSGAEDRLTSPPLTTSQRYKKRQRTKKDRQKAAAKVKASRSTKHAPKDSTKCIGAGPLYECFLALHTRRVNF